MAMMKAREMFAALGYRCIETGGFIWYINDSDNKEYRRIEFYFSDCTFLIADGYEPIRINVKEFEAIQKQMEELGWV